MFVVVAIKAKQFPIGPVRRIVVMIVVTVMHSQLAQTPPGEFTCAAPAHPRIKLERLFTISQFPLFARAPSLGNNPV